MIYVTSDIHGCFDEFMKMLQIIKFTNRDFMYIAGDSIDRGSKPMEVIEFIKNRPNIELLLGNHEEFMIEAIKALKYGKTNFIDMDMWLNHGGDTTYPRFLQLPHSARHDVIDYLTNRPLYKIYRNNIIVHAGVFTQGIEYNSLEELMHKQDRTRMLWAKEEFLLKPLDIKYNANVIFGHTPTSLIQELRHEPKTEIQIWHDKNRMCLDCGYSFGGRMACICLDTGEEYYVDNV